MIKFCFRCGSKLIEGKKEALRYDENTGAPTYSIRLTCEKVFISKHTKSGFFALHKINNSGPTQLHTDRFFEVEA